MGPVSVMEFPTDILDSARLTVADLKVELAIHLYEERRLAIGKAKDLAGMALWEFRQLLAARRISPHYDAEDLEEDVQTLRRLGRL